MGGSGSRMRHVNIYVEQAMWHICHHTAELQQIQLTSFAPIEFSIQEWKVTKVS